MLKLATVQPREVLAMQTVRITGVQMAVSPKLDENLHKILDHITKTDADYILFPEMSLSGRNSEFSEKNVHAALRQISAACRQSYVTAFIGTGWRMDGATYIQTRIISHEGNLLGAHEKIVPTDADRQFCKPGEELRVFRHHGLAFGCLIGNDMWVTPGLGIFPDPHLSSRLGQKGIQVLFHSVDSGTKPIYAAYHESNLILRAIESGCHICTANAASMNGPLNCPSGIVSPTGQWLAACPREKEHTYSYDLEIELEPEEA